MRKRLTPLTLTLMFVTGPLAVAADLQTELVAIEKSMWTAWGRKDAPTYTRLTTANYTVISDNEAPVVGQEANVKAMKSHNCELRGVAFKDVTLHRVGQDAAVLIYTAKQDIVCDGKAQLPNFVASAVYQQQNGKWVTSHYHSSPITQ